MTKETRSGLVAIKSLLGRDPCAHANTAIQMIDEMLAEQPAQQQEPVADEVRCPECGYLTKHTEHIGCLRKALKAINDFEQRNFAIVDMDNTPQPPAQQEPVAWVDGATHYQPHQKAFYKRVSATEWYVWSRVEQEPLHWCKALGTSDSAHWILRQPAQIAGFDVVLDSSMPPNEMKFVQPAQQGQVDELHKALADLVEAVCAVPDGGWPDGFRWASVRQAKDALAWLPDPQPAQQQEPEYIQLRHKEEDGFSPWGQPLDPKYRHNKWAAGVEMRLLYTSPQPAQRKPLTDEEITAIYNKTCEDWTNRYDRPVVFARAIEAAHGIGEKK